MAGDYAAAVMLPISRHIILIGMMGCGKSTVARLLARPLDMTWSDTDTLVEAAAGETVTDIINQRGEAVFRDLERQALQQVLAQPPQIIATGGGMVLNPDNCTDMRAAGHVVYLQAPAALLLARLPRTAAETRPLLGKDPDTLGQRLKNLLAQRDRLYRSTAHTVIEQEEGTLQDVVEKIMGALRQSCL